MTQDSAKKNRKQHILETLAFMLERDPSGKITTAKLAKEVGVSEAALYRHFPSKAKMFDALLDFIEDVLFSRIHRISEDSNNAVTSCRQIIEFILLFNEKNPGLCHILCGHAIVGENERLQQRVNQIFSRTETELKQMLRKAEVEQGLRFTDTATGAVELLLTLIEGKLQRFTRSQYQLSPSKDFDIYWDQLRNSLFEEASLAHS